MVDQAGIVQYEDGRGLHWAAVWWTKSGGGPRGCARCGPAGRDGGFGDGGGQCIGRRVVCGVEDGTGMIAWF